MMQRNCVFPTNADFLIPISLQPNVVDLKTFQLIVSVKSNGLSLKYQISTTPG